MMSQKDGDEHMGLQETQKPNDNELDKILDKVSWGDYRHKHGWGTGISNRPEIKAQLSAHFLSQALEIVGADEDPERIHVSYFQHESSCIPQLETWARDDLRTELRKAFKAKYAPKEGQ